MHKFTIDTEFRGIAGAKAYHVALSFVRSLYYLPMIYPQELDYFGVVEWFDKCNDEQKRRLLKITIDDGAMLEEDEIYALLFFAKDQNKMSLGKETIKNLEAFAITEIMLDVVCEIFKKKVFFCQMNK